jgi:hypothetical protein
MVPVVGAFVGACDGFGATDDAELGAGTAVVPPAFDGTGEGVVD